MDEGSGYCGSGGGIKRDEICLKKDSVESNMKSADRLGIVGLVVGREREGLTILEVC